MPLFLAPIRLLKKCISTRNKHYKKRSGHGAAMNIFRVRNDAVIICFLDCPSQKRYTVQRWCSI